MDTSGQINELAAALAKAQGQIVPAKYDAQNPHLKNRYTTLAAVWDVIRKPLSDNGLAVAQVVTTETDGLYLLTRLMHSSGQYIQAVYPITAGDSRGVSAAQAVGSALTYARRYSLTALVGVVSDDDDDGNSAADPQTRQPANATQGASTSTVPFGPTVKDAVDWACQTAPQVWPADARGIIVRDVVVRSLKKLSEQGLTGDALALAWIAKVNDKLLTWERSQQEAATDDGDGTWADVDAHEHDADASDEPRFN